MGKQRFEHIIEPHETTNLQTITFSGDLEKDEWDWFKLKYYYIMLEDVKYKITVTIEEY